jgi:GLPGLI family protein
MKKLFFSAAIALFSLAALAQDNVTVTYSVEMEGLPPEQAAMMKGMELKNYMKAGKTRSENSNPFSSTVSVIDDKGNSITLIDAMGQKKFMKGNAKDQKKEGKDPQITQTKDTKTIAGYECKKAKVKFTTEKGESQESTVWYTEKLKPSGNGGARMGQFKGLNGMPLEFEMNYGPMKMKMTATAVSTAPIPDSKFELSTEGYTEMSPEDMKMMGGGM